MLLIKEIHDSSGAHLEIRNGLRFSVRLFHLELLHSLIFSAEYRRQEYLFLVDLSSRHAMIVRFKFNQQPHPTSLTFYSFPSAMATSKGAINGRYNICRHIDSGSFGACAYLNLPVSLNISRKNICRL